MTASTVLIFCKRGLWRLWISLIVLVFACLSLEAFATDTGYFERRGVIQTISVTRGEVTINDTLFLLVDEGNEPSEFRRLELRDQTEVIDRERFRRGHKVTVLYRKQGNNRYVVVLTMLPPSTVVEY
jgi:hypothetical protein